MLRKGLQILLTDMSFTVVAAGSIFELEAALSATRIIPHLIIFPLRLENNQTTIELLRTLRRQYQFEIPAIFFYDDCSTKEAQFSDANLLMLSSEIQPANLRQKINQSIA